jgi:maleylacetoacetate isomerase/maleylpyruvate isomerase
LALKGVLYESALLDLEAGEHRAALASSNPNCTVPTLELDDGRVLAESVAILEWLEETVPEPPLLPADAVERARVRQLVQLVNSGIHPLQNTRVRKAISSDAEAQRAWCARWIEQGLQAYEAALAPDASFSVGDRLTMADLFLVPQMANAERHGADLSRCPRIRAIEKRCLELPEARATHPKVVELLRDPSGGFRA